MANETFSRKNLINFYKVALKLTEDEIPYGTACNVHIAAKNPLSLTIQKEYDTAITVEELENGALNLHIHDDDVHNALFQGGAPSSTDEVTFEFDGKELILSCGTKKLFFSAK